MERSGVVKSVVSMRWCLLMVMMVMGGVCAKSGFTKFMECYEGRFTLCVLLEHSDVKCAAKELAECTRLARKGWSSQAAGSMVKVSPKQSYCELGCALTRCTNISTQLDPKVEEVGTCVESCSEDITCKPKTSGNDEPKTKTTDEQTIDEFCKLGCAKSICGETAEKDDPLCLLGSCTTTCS